MRRDGLAAALVATTAAQGLATLAVFVLPVLAPLALPALGLPARLVGWQVALVYVLAATTSGFAGGALQRWGPARCTQIALGAAALGCLAIALGGLPGVALGSVLIGSGYGLTNPAASQVLARLAPAQRRNLIYGIKQTGVPLGAALAGAVLPTAGLWLGWHGAAIAFAAVLLAATLWLGLFRAAWDTATDATAPLRAGAGGLGVLAHSAPLRAVSLTGALYAAIQLSLSTYAVTMLVEEFHWSPVQAGGAAAIMQLVGAAARLAWAVPADRIGGLPMLAIIGMASVVAALLMPWAPGWHSTAVLVLLSAMGFCVAGWNGVLMAEASRLGGRMGHGVAVGAVVACSFAGVVAGPSVFALLVAWWHSYAMAFAIMAVLPLAGGIIAWQAHRLERSGN